VQSAIELQKLKAQQKRNKLVHIGQNRTHIERRAATVKRNVNRFFEKLMAVIKAKKKELLNKVQIQVKESCERLRTEEQNLGEQIKLIETEIEKTETLVKRSKSDGIVQMDKSLNTSLEVEVSDEEDQVDCDLEGFRRFIFEENKTLMAKTLTEGIGAFKTFLSKTNANQSGAQGKGMREAIVGLEAQLVLTTRKAEGEQCHDERDCVTVEIRNRQGQDCTTKVQDNKDGSYNFEDQLLR